VKCWQRFAAWARDNLPGGVSAQNVLFDAFPTLAAMLDELAFRRDRERTSLNPTQSGELLCGELPVSMVDGTTPV
jgi:hypothetical protein